MGLFETVELLSTIRFAHDDAMEAGMADVAADRPLEIQFDRMEHHGIDLVSGI
jgi:hypothetical protein